MKLPPKSVISDTGRLRAVERLAILDTPPEAAFDRLTKLVSQVLEAPIAVISIIDGERQFIKSEAGLPEDLARQREVPLSHSLCAYVVALEQPVMIEDGPLDSRFSEHPAIQGLNIGSYLGVPVVTADGDIIGTLCVIDHKPRIWRPDATEILSGLADSVMSEIELRSHVRDVSDAYDTLLDRHSTLQQHTSQMDALLNSGAGMLSILSVQGEMLYTSPSVSAVLGYRAEDLVGTSAFDLMHPEDRPAVVESFEKLFDIPGVGVPIVFRIRHADGSWRFLEAVGTNHLETPSILGMVINARDVTDRKRLEALLARQNEELKGLLASRTRELDEARFEILERLAVAAEYRDDVTGQHTRRVGQLAGRLATLLGYPHTQVGYIERSAPLHDVGKIGISDQILLKPGRLTPEERAAMERHTLIGARILAGSRVPYLQLAQEIAVSHHERWDGNGYPYGLAGEEIPHAGRVVAVADVLDALTHDRPYKTAWGLDDAIEEITLQSGKQFDPAVVNALLTLYHQYHADAVDGRMMAEFEGHGSPAEVAWGDALAPQVEVGD